MPCVLQGTITSGYPAFRLTAVSGALVQYSSEFELIPAPAVLPLLGVRLLGLVALAPRPD
jgi:hypothetical protein